ncbi:DUF4224 domain-containing protein [Comamonas sediminis]|uniref:DUF4224 domain-containing protein n=1 Tax=Comamonas sediminis TaxID=1783360 RepID=A0ABV4B6H0_9BURK
MSDKDSEFLSDDEVSRVTGYKQAAPQREWLDNNGWVYTVSGAGRPIVGRWFARLRMAGMKAVNITLQPVEMGMQPVMANVQSAAKPNFSALD